MPPLPRIAVLEDEPSLLVDLCDFLQTQGFSAQGFHSAEAFYGANPCHAFDLVLLDIGLPGDNGLQVAQWLRARNCTAGIVMLTAFGSPHDHVHGLEAGGDAYLVKNTPMEIIEATCRSVLRRLATTPAVSTPASAPAAMMASADTVLWQLHPKCWQLTLPQGQTADLTHTETVFLQTLLRQVGTPVSREALLAALGKEDTPSNRRNLENGAGRLRRKLMEQHGVEVPIRTSYSQGYTFTGLARIADT